MSPVTRVFDEPGLPVQERGNRSYSLAGRLAYICNGMELNDHHINYCQSLLKKQFPLIGGLLLTSLQNKPIKQKIGCGLQIIHCNERNHWIVASRIDSCHSPIKIYEGHYKTRNIRNSGIRNNGISRF